MKYIFLLISSSILIAYGAIQPAWAADTMLTPSIGLTTMYDDNVSFQRGGEKNDDFIYAIQPALTYDYATEINKLKAKALFDYQGYIDNDAYNSLDQVYNLNGSSNFTELLTIIADLEYIKDNTLKSQLTETGKVEAREDRQRYDLTGGLFLNVTELIRIGGDYQYRQTEYDSESTEDFNDDTVSFIYNQRLKNQLDSFTFRTSYAYREVRTHETNTYMMTLGWIREFSETLNLRANFGGRFTEQYSYDSFSTRDKSETSGFLANVRFFKQSDFMMTVLEYRRNLVYGSRSDGAREVDLFKIGLNRNLTERLKAGIDLKLYLTRDVDVNASENSQFYEVQPSIVYNLTEYHLLGLFYNYQNEYDDTQADGEEDADRSRIWLSLIFNFPNEL